jgi:hypothetical protein
MLKIFLLRIKVIALNGRFNDPNKETLPSEKERRESFLIPHR